MILRALTANDATDYAELRLAALREHPEAYVTDIAEESALSLDDFQKRLADTSTAQTFGAFEGDKLIGIATLLCTTRIRQRFRATIVGMYVLPDYRRRGVAKRLLEVCVEQARSRPEIEEVSLCITVGNEAARKTYLAFGFQPEFVEPRYFKYDGKYYDLEWMGMKLR